MDKIKNIVIKNKNQIVLIAFAFIFITYLIKPICFDVKLYIDAAYRADCLGGFPNNIVDAWEHKYLLNRLLYYVMFLIASIFVDFNNTIIFEFAIKVIYGIITLAVIYYFSKSTKSFFEKYNISEKMVFGILYCIIFLAGICFAMQTEITAFLVLLLAISFILKDKLKYHILSAFIISMLFWFKGVTLLYSVIILAVMLISNFKIRKIIMIVLCSCAFLGFELLTMYMIYPNEITTMYLATQYLIKSNVVFINNLHNFIFAYANIGIIFFIYNMFMHIKCKNIKLLILEIIVWLFLILGVIIQKSPFVYSLGLIIPSSVFSIFVYMYYLIYNKQKIRYVAKLLIIIFVSLIIIFNAIEDIMSTKRIYEQTLNACNNVQILQKEIPDLNEEEVLYIGNGLSSYYLKVKPYINYVTTIFFANENEAYMQSEYVNNLNEKVLNYAGKYIIIDSTEMSLKFRVSDKILEYIEKNYHYKQSTNISVYEIENEDCSLIYERNE